MTNPPRDFGVVFDIDGVILRGEDLIPGSCEAVLKASREQRRRRRRRAAIEFFFSFRSTTD
jgi:hypothetical protein